MTIYNLSKGLNNDVNGQILKDWINTNKANIHNLIIRDTGAATIENTSDLFHLSDFTSINLSDMNTSNVVDMSSMFSYCANLTNVPNFNTSNVTNMSRMFHSCTNLTNVSNFNASNVVDMGSMFSYCINLINVPSFSTSNVTNMCRMFDSCTNLTNVPNFNTSNVTNMSNIFLGCNNLTNESIQNIVNMCINSNITSSAQMNLSNTNSSSPLYGTIFNSSYYSDRLSDLTNAGWTY